MIRVFHELVINVPFKRQISAKDPCSAPSFHQATEESWSQGFVPSISREYLGHRDWSGGVRHDGGEKDSKR